jgi:WD40 repeat protein
VYLALLGIVVLVIFFVARADDPLYSLSLPEDSRVVAVSFRPDGTYLATGFRDGTIKLWDATDGTERATLTPPQMDDYQTIERMVFSLDGTRLAVINAVSQHVLPDNRIHLWDIPDRTLLHTLEHPTGRMRQVVVSPDGRRLAARAFDDTRRLSVIRVWDTTDGTLLDTFEGQPRTRNVIAFSPDGTLLAVSYVFVLEEYQIHVSDLAAGTVLHTLNDADVQFVDDMEFSPDGTRLATMNEFPHNIIHLWNVTDGTLLQTIDDHAGHVNTVVDFSADGTRLVTASRESGAQSYTIHLWDTADGTLLHTTERAQVGELVSNAAGTLLVGQQGSVWRVAD